MTSCFTKQSMVLQSLFLKIQSSSVLVSWCIHRFESLGGCVSFARTLGTCIFEILLVFCLVPRKCFVRSGIRTHAWRTRLRPERSALDRSAILTLHKKCQALGKSLLGAHCAIWLLKIWLRWHAILLKFWAGDGQIRVICVPIERGQVLAAV